LDPREKAVLKPVALDRRVARTGPEVFIGFDEIDDIEVEEILCRWSSDTNGRSIQARIEGFSEMDVPAAI
jgi:hypothetical protein